MAAQLLDGESIQDINTYGTIEIDKTAENNSKIASCSAQKIRLKHIIFTIFCVAFIFVIILRFGIKSPISTYSHNTKSNHLIPFCEKGAVGANWNGKLLMFGGKTKGHNFLNYLLYYDPMTFEWNKVFIGNRSHNKKYPSSLWKSAGVIWKNNFYIYGGSSSYHRQSEQNILYQYDLVNNKWNELNIINETNHPYVRAHCMAVNGDEIVLFGGKDIFGYDQNWIWHYNVKQSQNGFVQYDVQSVDVPAGRQAATCQIIQGKFVVFGGRQEVKILTGKYFRYFNDLWSFDLEKLTWKELKMSGGNIPLPAAHLSSVAYERNKFVVTGGHNSKNVLTQNWMFDFYKMEWTQLADLPNDLKRCEHVGIYVEGIGMILFSGQQNLPDQADEKSILLNDVILYDFDKNIWQILKQSHCNKAEEFWSTQQKI